jgi:hypothetical protein
VAREIRGRRPTVETSKTGPGFSATLEYRGITPRSARANALSKVIGRLRSAERLPLDEDLLVEFWGGERCWAHRFASGLWLYYKPDPSGTDEIVVLLAVHDHLHEQ